ncbi:MAG: hypothetical protein IJ124_06055 [Clostridia bacterium]|nr:hypothetical protein [Clostridia bacterium]
MIFNRNGKKASGGVSGLGNCLIFSSLSDFTLKVYDSAKHWDGTLYWTDGQNDWAVWDGTTTLQSVDGFLALRGTGNSKITGTINNNYRWVLTGANIRCDGNIETLLNYQTVASGNHPVMGDYCYYGMFGYCGSLVSAPELAATTPSQGCYRMMFHDCSLISAPALPAMTLKSYCYMGMFYNCSKLTSAPALPATTLAGSCYSSMFSGCKALTSAPALPATTLAGSCYSSMFSGCKALTSAPALPATTLASSCYSGMFQGCTKVKLSTTQTGDYQYEYRIPKTGTGTVETDSLKNMFTSTGGTFTGTPTINTTYYTDHPPIAA